MWQSWDLNPSQNLKAIALPILSYWSSEHQGREEIKHGEAGADRELERVRRPEENGGEESVAQAM